MAPRPSLHSYTVGWISALPIELAAAVEMFDEHFQDLPPGPDDPSLYTLGRMDHHNVVLTCLPAGRTGTTSAATIAMQMKSKFRSLRFYLMVGIGGGVPGEDHDIRLGDVVVSQPHMGHGGVVQYDFGKETPDGFLRTGFLNAPPTVLLHALSRLQANHFRGKNNLPTYMARYEHLPGFTRDKAGPDLLFESTYDHVKGVGRGCQRCDTTKLVERELREPEGIQLHYGTIASGNQVMKYGQSRDRLKKEMGDVLCVEMEAAGVVDNIRCLVIRGICDYADSHKNDKWHAPAAAAAAACAREILSVIPAPEIAATDTVEEALQTFSISEPTSSNQRTISPPPLLSPLPPKDYPPLPSPLPPKDYPPLPSRLQSKDYPPLPSRLQPKYFTLKDAPTQPSIQYGDNTSDSEPDTYVKDLHGTIWLEDGGSSNSLFLAQSDQPAHENEIAKAYHLEIGSTSHETTINYGDPTFQILQYNSHNSPFRRHSPGSIPWPPMSIRVAELTLNIPGQVFSLDPELTCIIHEEDPNFTLDSRTPRRFAVLHPKLFTPDKGHPWRGIWSAGKKFILFHQPAERYLEAIILTGDTEMLAGERLLVVEDLFNAQGNQRVRASFTFYKQGGDRTSMPVYLVFLSEDMVSLQLHARETAITFVRVWARKRDGQRVFPNRR